MRGTHRTVDLFNPDAHYELFSLPDCVSLDDKGGCCRIVTTHCLGDGCRFSQTRQEAEDSLERWSERLSGFDETTQHTIAKKYYGGTMPWKVHAARGFVYDDRG